MKVLMSFMVVGLLFISPVFCNWKKQTATTIIEQTYKQLEKKGYFGKYKFFSVETRHVCIDSATNTFFFKDRAYLRFKQLQILWIPVYNAEIEAIWSKPSFNPKWTPDSTEFFLKWNETPYFGEKYLPFYDAFGGKLVIFLIALGIWKRKEIGEFMSRD